MGFHIHTLMLDSNDFNFIRTCMSIKYEMLSYFVFTVPFADEITGSSQVWGFCWWYLT